MKMGKVFRTVLTAGFVMFSSNVAMGESFIDDSFIAHMRDYIKSDIIPWLTDPILINAIHEQNIRHANLHEIQIKSMDEKWRAETEHRHHPMIEGILTNQLSKFLAQKQDESDGMLLEIFVMDAKGLNVGQSRVTTDYWQGDEEKWTQTFLKGPNALHISDVDIDSSTGTFQSQASLSISDPETGNVIGAITLGFSFELL